MKPYKSILFSLFILLSTINIAISQPVSNHHNAPTTTVSSATACPGDTIILPVTAINIVNTAGIGLELYYDGAVLSYIDTNPNQLMGNYHNSNTTLYSFGGDFSIAQSNYIYTSGYKKVRPYWSMPFGITGGVTPSIINNIAQLFDLTFMYYGGSTTVSFNNSGIYSGQYCEWADSLARTYIDTPTINFYINGMVTQCDSDSNVAINNINNSYNDILIRPNPAKEAIYIKNAEEGDIIIYNLLGEAVIRTKSRKGENTINVASLADGSYIIKIVSLKNVVAKKFIISRE